MQYDVVWSSVVTTGLVSKEIPHTTSPYMALLTVTAELVMSQQWLLLQLWRKWHGSL